MLPDAEELMVRAMKSDFSKAHPANEDILMLTAGILRQTTPLLSDGALSGEEQAVRHAERLYRDNLVRELSRRNITPGVIDGTMYFLKDILR